MTNTRKLAGRLNISMITLAFVATSITQYNGSLLLSPPPTQNCSR